MTGADDDPTPEELRVDADPTPEELREAEALAEALDRGRAMDDLPQDALESANLLRAAGGETELDPAREKAILEDVFREARPPKVTAAPSWWSRLGFRGAFALTAAAAAVVLAINFVRPLEDAGRAMVLPTPPKTLLEAQARAATGDRDGVDALRTAMRPYRVSVYQALGDRYGR